MTREELEKEAKVRADEYQKRKHHQRLYGHKPVIMKELNSSFKDGYIDGAEAHSVQWHDLRKDPCDIPNRKGNVVLNQDGDKVTYDYLEGRWRWTDGGIHGLEMTAWCELPKFEG